MQDKIGFYPGVPIKGLGRTIRSSRDDGRVSYQHSRFAYSEQFMVIMHFLKLFILSRTILLISGEYPDKTRKLGLCLSEALKLVLLIGLIFMAFGPSYSYALIRLLYGQKWSDGEAPTALRYYCLYIIVLAMNGTSEAFLHAVANESQLKKSNDSLLLFSLIYVMLNFQLIQSSGVVGLIFANSINMILRITYSAIFIKRYFKNSSFSFSSCLPSGWIFLLFSGVLTLISERLFMDQQNFWSTFSLHFSIGLVCFLVSLFVIYRRERSFINKIIHFRQHSD